MKEKMKNIIKDISVIYYFIKFIGALLVFFVIRINQTNLLSNMVEEYYYKGTKLYTYYDMLFPYDISQLIVLTSLIYIVFKAPDFDTRWYEVCTGIGCGLCSLMGLSFRVTQTWECVVKFKAQSLFYILGFTYAWIIVLKYIKHYVNILKCNNAAEKNSTITFDIFQNSYFVFLFVFSVWLIWAVLRFPGGINYDEYHQINFILNNSEFNQHWPVMTTYYYGGLVKLGQNIFHSKNFGLFLCIIGQMLVGAYAVTRSDKVMKNQGVNIKIRGMIIVVFAINPLIARYMTTASKDSLYASILLGVTVLMADVILCGEGGKTYIELLIFSVLLCLTRKNGTITLLLMAIVFLAVSIWKGLKDRDRKATGYVLFALIFGILFNFAFENIMVVMGHEKSGVGEGLSVPLQQIARVSRDYPEVVSESDREIINRVIDFEEIGKLYYPKKSDAVKDTYYGDNTRDLVSFMKVWFKYLLKVPSIYIQAFFHMNGDFLDVNSHYIELNKIDPEYSTDFMPYKIESYFRIFTDFYEGFPLVWPICNVGIQAWLSVYLLLMAFSKKNKEHFILALPAVINLLICMMGPTFENNGIRYLIPTVMINPFVLGLALDSRRNIDS